MTLPQPAAPPAPPRPGAAAAPSLPRIPAALVLGALFVALASWSWGKWPDVLVDFGHELYVPWQLVEGKVLGRDLEWLTGPLSPHVNAALFAVLGVGTRTLFLANLAWLAALTALLHHLLRELSGRAAALAATCLFLVVFAFGQYVGTGNYNYVAPYSHGATHGALLSAVALALVGRFARRGHARDLAGASLALGLVFLAKPELFVACAAAYAVALALLVRRGGAASARPPLVAAATLPALLPALLLFAYVAARSDGANAARVTLGGWLAIGSGVARTPFYLSGIGLDDPAGNVWRALRALGVGVLALAPAAIADVALRARAPRGLAAIAAAAVTGAGLAALPTAAWFEAGRPLPLLAGLGALVAFVRAWRSGRACDASAVLRAAFATFAAMLLLKMALNARLYHYGFVLAMPATLLVVTWLVAAVPERLRRLGGSGVVFRGAALAAIAMAGWAHLSHASAMYAQKTVPVGSGPDVFLADGRGKYVNAVLEALAREGRPGETLAVLPEGVMMSYLARRATPSRYVTYLPDAMAAWGEPALLASLSASPPAFLVVVSRDASEFGPATFGVDYGQEMLAWIRGNYTPIGTVGASPLVPHRYGMAVLRRRDGGAAGTEAP